MAQSIWAWLLFNNINNMDYFNRRIKWAKQKKT